MANTVLLKRSSTPGKVPTTGQMSVGELAFNTYDGKLYGCMNSGTASVVQLGGAAVSSFSGGTTGLTPSSATTGAITLAGTLAVANGGTGVTTSTGTGSVVLSAGPTFTGVPAAPTAAASTNTTQIATTAFVLGQASSTTPNMDGTAAVGTGTTFARADHTHPTDTSRAPLASPSFTGNATFGGTGTIQVPVGTTAQRPTAVQGMIRYNTTRGCFEGYDGTQWINMSPLTIDAVGATA